VLLGISGGIAAYKTPELVRRLRDAGCEVRCALTRAAAAFVSPLSLEVVSGVAVRQGEWLEPNGSGEELHIEAAAWADLLLVAPATAHLLSRLSLGLADDFLTATALAFSGPVVAAPAMHAAMWSHPATRERVATLAARGVRFVGPVAGPLASGEVGTGRMAEIPDIVRAAVETLGPRDLAGRTVLVTAGPTLEAIDPVRYLANRSSGRMGFALAAEAARRGARSILVAGPVALETPAGVERVDVESALEMEAAVRRLAPDSDLVIMAAAVADFRPERAAPAKIKRGAGVPELRLVANPDILAGLAALAPRALRVGFAAETGASDAEARRKLEQKGAGYLVVNDVSRSDIGFGAEDNEVTVYHRDGDPVFLSRRAKPEVARALFDLFSRALARPTGAPPAVAG
jgi:phosphopantothenoylcysteine decarboxylase / phosphopantothenate---cysteine ligase